VNTNTDDVLSEDDADEKGSGAEYVAVEQEDVRAEAHADDDDGDDERLDSDNEDREELRRRRREEKVERSHRRKAAIERDKAELAFLRQKTEEQERRLAAMEHRSATHDFAALNQRLKDTQEEVRAAEYVIAKATEAGNGDDVVAAMRVRDEAIAKLNQLSAVRGRAQPKQAPQQPPEQAPPAHQQLAQDWVKMNSWFDPQGRDERSRKVLEIDKSLVNEGYNPVSLEYWHELDRRVDPHRRAKGGPPMGSGRERSASTSKNEVYISPERKQAMIDAGVWDDKNARQRYLKAYSEWDRNNATR
jgi:hypothetical protein